MTGAWTPLSSSSRYARGRLALREDVWRLPDGREVTYPVLAVVGVLPFVEPDRVLLVGQYRHLQRALSWELPGGGAATGEDPPAAAQREPREEGGYRARRTPTSTRSPTATRPGISRRTPWPPTTTSSSSGAWCRWPRRSGWP
jgi:8-oxo-dGTP pyrophosphatase MutT (NUDIX family)